MKKIISLLLLATVFSLPLIANAAFRIRDIQVEGLERLSKETVISYLPVKKGEVLTTIKSSEVVHALYNTGFFERIYLTENNRILVIHVIERSTIGELKITGNSLVPTDRLTSVMRSLDIAEGRAYNAAVLEKIKQSLIAQYYQLGRYNARVDVRVSKMSRNRVYIQVIISEGLIARIRGITIIGNKTFSEDVLISQLEMTTSGLFTLFTQTDRYSELKLEQSIEKLRGYYLDHGFLHVEVTTAQAQLTPDRKYVYITFIVEEGEPYTIESVSVGNENGIFSDDEYTKRILITPGEFFSRQKILDTQKKITDFLGNNGYIYSTVSVHPTINETNRTVKVTFTVNPGKKTYVRHVTFSNNTRTNDIVLRREVMQMEAAPVSTRRLNISKQRLNLLPYMKNVDMSIKPVEDIDDQVDVNYSVLEDSGGQVSFKLGYSQIQHLLLGGGINQKNVFGTGNTLGLNVSASSYEKFIGFDYTNPYYTESGISRTISFSASRVDPGHVSDVNGDYTTNEVDLGIRYGIPIGDEEGVYSRFYVGTTLQNTFIHLNRKRTISNQVLAFVKEHGKRFRELDLNVGFSRDSRDRAIFPTRGFLQTLFVDTYAPIGPDSLSFYTVNYHARYYLPLIHQFIFTTRVDLGYGNGFNGINDFPFFKNYFAGGIDSVHGYGPFTLGPRDSNGQAYGGNLLTVASMGIILPKFISDNLRTTAFIDAGNVYSSLNMTKFPCTSDGCSRNAGPLRYSAGIEVEFMIPAIGPIRLSLAAPLTLHHHDDSDPFQLSMGTSF